MEENKVFGQLHGEIIITLKNPDGAEEIRNYKNIIVNVASALMAELMSRDGSIARPYVPGAQVLAVGTGGLGWDLQNPPVATVSQTQLENELDRNIFSDVTYVDGLGVPTITRTNIVDFSTTFGPSEANGALVEMGLFGGTNSTAAVSGTMLNYKTFPVLNKASGSTLTIVWRLTF